jgi:hypothetical protein
MRPGWLPACYLGIFAACEFSFQAIDFWLVVFAQSIAEVVNSALEIRDFACRGEITAAAAVEIVNSTPAAVAVATAGAVPGKGVKPDSQIENQHEGPEA